MKLLTLCVILLSSVALFAGEKNDCSQCLLKGEHEVIEQTKLRIADKHPMRVVAPFDILAGHDYACVLIRFTIGEDGSVETAEQVRSYPHSFLLRSALYALYRTQFLTPEHPQDREGMLLFELFASDSKEEKPKHPQILKGTDKHGNVLRSRGNVSSHVSQSLDVLQSTDLQKKAGPVDTQIL